MVHAHLMYRAEVAALFSWDTVGGQGIPSRCPVPVVMVAQDIVPGHLQRCCSVQLCKRLLEGWILDTAKTICNAEVVPVLMHCCLLQQ